ncbi:MAG: ArnT family glycosyltransferase, partial [Alphaproteobacteria bacterium]
MLSTEVLRRPGVRLGLLLTIGVASFVVLPAAADPLDGDPAMWATIARTVGASGDWLRLRFNGEPYFNKPPLFFWATWAAMKAAGANAFGASLASGLFGVLDLLLLWAVGRVMFRSSDVGFAAALAFATTHEVVHWTRGVHLESLLVAWNLLGLLAAHRSVEDPRAIVPLAAALAGGWLTKGPQGLFPAAVAAALWAREGRLRERLVSRPARLGAALLALAVLPWLVAQLTSEGAFFHEYVRGQIGAVMFGSGDVPRGIAFYPQKLFATYWPWLPFAAAGAWMLGRGRPSTESRLWLLDGAIVGLVMLAATVRKTRYLYPLYPALSVYAGVALVGLARRVPRLLDALGLAALVSALAIAALAGRGQDRSAQTLERRDDAIAIASLLPPDARTWLARDVSLEDSPGLGKVLGFHAAPLLCDCGSPCTPSGRGPIRVVALAADADQVAAEIGGTVLHRTRSLALVGAPDGADVRGTTCVDVAPPGGISAEAAA